jgi:hypothetical protein
MERYLAICWMIAVQVNVGGLVENDHFALVPAHKFSFSSSLSKSRKHFSHEWDRLKLDPYMADGGRYRFRRYGLFNLSIITGRLNCIPDASFYQDININPLNGGKLRKFASLTKDSVENPFLQELMLFDLAQLTSTTSVKVDWLIGVHQIRIIAMPGASGNPTPEGVHRDDETYTVQHLIKRHNIDGGVNYFHGSEREPERYPTVLKQLNYFDSYYFDHTLWHSVSPITLNMHGSEGYRDVLLIDFTPQ